MLGALFYPVWLGDTWNPFHAWTGAVWEVRVGLAETAMCSAPHLASRVGCQTAPGRAGRARVAGRSRGSSAFRSRAGVQGRKRGQ